MKFACLLACLIAGLSTAVVAQTPAAPPPLSTRTPLQYKSAFADYRAYLDVAPVPWRRANDDAAAVGGPMGQMAHDTNPGATAKPGAPTTAPANSGAIPMGGRGKSQ